MVIVLEELAEILVGLRKEDDARVVLATGVFDLLHVEHIRFLERAKEAGEVLIVGCESDVRVKRLKGEDRPVWDEQKRVAALGELVGVDYAFVLPEVFDTNEDYEALIEALRPDVYAVSEHSPFMDNKVRIMEKYGGVVGVVHVWNPEVSTTKLLAE